MSVVKLEVAQILFSLQDILALNVTISLENGRIASRHLAMEALSLSQTIVGILGSLFLF